MKLLEASFKIKMVGKEDDLLVRMGRVMEGEEYIGMVPFPSDKEEAWNRMIHQYACQIFLELQFDHLEKYDAFKSPSVNKEIEKLKEIIEEAEKGSSIFYANNEHNAKFGDQSEINEYSRISNGFYANRYVFDYSYLIIARTYAKFLMWLPFLEYWLKGFIFFSF